MKKLTILLATLIITLLTFGQGKVEESLRLRITKSSVTVSGREYPSMPIDAKIEVDYDARQMKIHINTEILEFNFRVYNEFEQNGFKITCANVPLEKTQIIIQKKVGENWYAVSVFDKDYQVYYTGYKY